MKKSLYVWKQSGRNRLLTLKAFLITRSFFISIQDECLFIKKLDEKIIVFFAWLDDLIVAEVCKKFKISDYSDSTWTLGMKIERNSSEIKITQ